jgi:hypothetical protein
MKVYKNQKVFLVFVLKSFPPADLIEKSKILR